MIGITEFRDLVGRDELLGGFGREFENEDPLECLPQTQIKYKGTDTGR